MRILVTGGAGFVGSHVAEYYAQQGEEVVVFDNLSRAEFLDSNRSVREEIMKNQYQVVLNSHKKMWVRANFLDTER